MKPNIFLKSTARQPIRSILLLLLIGVISFAFVSRATEYLIIMQETNRIGAYYRPIGRLETDSPLTISFFNNNTDSDGELTSNNFTASYDWENLNYDVSSGVELIEQSKYLDFSDYTWYRSGVMENSYSVNLDGTTSAVNEFWSFSKDFELYNVNMIMLYGTLISKELEVISNSLSVWYFEFLIDEIVEGFPEYARVGGTTRVYYVPENSGEGEEMFSDILEGERYFFKMQQTVNNIPFRGVKTTFLVNKLQENLWFIPAEEGEYLDFDTPEMLYLKTDLEILRENTRAMILYSTKDMTALPDFQENVKKYYLTDGRWINREDDLNQNQVCVIHSDFAQQRGFDIGDTISFTMRDTGHGAYILSGSEFWKELPTYEREFEIVGIYNSVKRQSSPDTTVIYIPDSGMPNELKTGVVGEYYGSYSFVLKSVFDKQGFIEEYQEPLAALGITIKFMEDNSEAFLTSTAQIRQSTSMSVVVFGVLLLIALALSAFLYLFQKRREFAITYALGTPKRTAIRKMLLPLMLISAAGITAGSVFAWNYAGGKAAETLYVLQAESSEASLELPTFWLFLMILFIMLTLLCITLYGTYLSSRHTALQLLQGGGAVKQKNKPVTDSADKVTETLELREIHLRIVKNENLAKSKKASFSAFLQFIFQRIRRAKLKSLLSISVALAFILALGQIHQTMILGENEIERLYATTVVEGEIIRKNNSGYIPDWTGFINNSTVKQILDSGLVSDAYFEVLSYRWAIAGMLELSEIKTATTPYSKINQQTIISIIASSDMSIFLESNPITITYAEGYDETYFDTEWTAQQIDAGEIPPIILSETMAATVKASLGGTVYIEKELNQAAKYLVAGIYSGTIGAGSLYISPVLTSYSILCAIEEASWREPCYSTAKFTFDKEKNRELLEVSSTFFDIVEDEKAGTLPLRMLLWDEELRMAIAPMEKNIELMQVLYPVTVAASVLIAAGLSILLMLQNARTAATMRILGATKKRVRFALCLEQTILCFFGIMLGFATLAATSAQPQDSFWAVMLCAALYLTAALAGALFASISVSNRSPLELLQVKE